MSPLFFQCEFTFDKFEMARMVQKGRKSLVHTSPYQRWLVGAFQTHPVQEAPLCGPAEAILDHHP